MKKIIAVFILAFSFLKGQANPLEENLDPSINDVEVIIGERKYIDIVVQNSEEGLRFRVASMWLHPIFDFSDSLRRIRAILKLPGQKVIRISQQFEKDAIEAARRSSLIPLYLEKKSVTGGWFWKTTRTRFLSRAPDTFRVNAWALSLNDVPLESKNDLAKLSLFNDHPLDYTPSPSEEEVAAVIETLLQDSQNFEATKKQLEFLNIAKSSDVIDTHEMSADELGELTESNPEVFSATRKFLGLLNIKNLDNSCGRLFK